MFKEFGSRALAAYEAEGFFATEYQMRRKSGEVFPTEHFARPIYNAEHQLQNVVNVVRDITERKRADEELKRSNQELTALNMVIAAINRFLKLSDIISTLHMLLADHLHIDAGAILLYHEEDDCLALESAWGLPDALVHDLSHTPMHLTHNAHIVYEQVPIIVSDMRSDAVLMRVIPPDPPDTPAEEEYKWVYLGIPLLAQGKTQGVVNLFKHEQSATSTDQFAFFVTLGQQVGSAMQNARLFAEVVAGREHLQHLSHQLVKVQEAERYAIARELHDEVGQILTGLNLTLEMVARLPVEEVYPRLEEAHTMVNDLMLRVREMSLQLRPPMLDDLGLLAALLWHVERYTSQTGIVVHFRQAGLERRFAAEVEIAIYRMVQEALTNVARYAGTSDVVVRLWSNDAMLGVQIEDQGNGFDPEEVLSRHTTSGLSGMRERLRLLGGELQIDAAPGQGCCLAVEIPLQREPVG
jgi:signal transduction histidine kinase